MNPKLAKLLHEGFSINTLENLSETQLNVLYKKVLMEQGSTPLNLSKSDAEGIAKAKSEKKPFVTYEEEIGEEEEVTEKAISKKQQEFFGLVRGMQKGTIPKKGKAGEAAKEMKKKDVKDFASTKHKGLPTKVKEKDNVKKLEESILRLIESHLPPHTTKGELLSVINKKNTLLEEPTDYKGFALSVVGTLMKYLNSWGGHAEVYKQVMKIDTKAKYDAVLELCKTSPALKSKYGRPDPNDHFHYYEPRVFPFNTVMAFIQTGDSNNLSLLDTFAEHLRKWNPNEKVYKPKHP
jgi:hypothetical protein